MSARKILAVTVVLIMLVSGVAFAITPTGAVDEHEDDDAQEPTEDGVADSQLQVTVEDATIVLLSEDSEMADDAPADVADNESAVDDSQQGVTVLESSVEVTVEQASIVGVGDQSAGAAEDANGLDSSDTEDDANGVEDDTANESDDAVADDSATDDAIGGQEITVQEATIFVVVEDGDQPTDANGAEDGDAMNFQEATAFVLVEDTGEMLADQPVETENGAADDDESDAVDDDDNDTDAVDDNESDAGDDGDGLDEDTSDAETDEDRLQVTIEEATIFIVIDATDDQPAEEPIAEDDEPADDDNESEVDDDESDVDDNETGVDDDNETQDDDTADAAVTSSCSC